MCVLGSEALLTNGLVCPRGAAHADSSKSQAIWGVAFRDRRAMLRVCFRSRKRYLIRDQADHHVVRPPSFGGRRLCRSIFFLGRLLSCIVV
jgi:hypothetical protein